MAWIVMDLDQTLVNDSEMGEVPVDGAVEACAQLAQAGHRLTVLTSRFAPMPESERQRLKEQIEGDLAACGFPPMEVWTGTSKPDADIFLGHNHVTYDGDWALALAQIEAMLSEMGLQPEAMPEQEQMPQEGEQVEPEEPDVG